MKEVLVISPTALAPWPGGGGPRTAAACKYLPRSGWQASLLAADMGADRPDWAGPVRCITAPWPRLLRRGARTEVWKAPGRARKPSVLMDKLWAATDRALSLVLFPDESATWVPKAVKAARREFASAPPQAVLSMAPRFAAHVVGERLSRLWHVPWVAEFQDPFVGNVFMPWPTPLHRKAAARVERRWVERAAAVTTTTETLRQELAARYTHLGQKVTVISNGYDPIESEPVALDQEHCHIVHCGQFYGGRVPDHFLEALAALGRRRPDLATRMRVHFVGPVNQRTETAARHLGLSDIVRSEGVVSNARSLGWMRAADLLLLIKHVSPAAAAQVPTKLYEYISAAKPILALAHESEMAQILKQARGGVTVPPTDVEAISRAVEDFADGRFADFRPDQSYSEQFALPTLMHRMAEVLDSALSAAVRKD